MNNPLCSLSLREARQGDEANSLFYMIRPPKRSGNLLEILPRSLRLRQQSWRAPNDREERDSVVVARQAGALLAMIERGGVR
ncbi:MAG TPA: hypothetical protein VLA49_13715 [Anaerolineales bacterium]|nr:hypothetical protein [Anaerolineales bacterium]